MRESRTSHGQEDASFAGVTPDELAEIPLPPGCLAAYKFQAEHEATGLTLSIGIYTGNELAPASHTRPMVSLRFSLPTNTNNNNETLRMFQGIVAQMHRLLTENFRSTELVANAGGMRPGKVFGDARIIIDSTVLDKQTIAELVGQTLPKNGFVNATNFAIQCRKLSPEDLEILSATFPRTRT